jgi:hypothetical protein
MLAQWVFTGTNPLGSPKLKLYERLGLLAITDKQIYLLLEDCHTCSNEAACMRRKKAQRNYRKVVLRLPDLCHASVMTTERCLGCKQNLEE